VAPRTKGEPCLSHPCSQGFSFALRPATNDRPQGMNNAESGRPTRRGRDADVTLAVASLSRLEARDLRHDSTPLQPLITVMMERLTAARSFWQSWWHPRAGRGHSA